MFPAASNAAFVGATTNAYKRLTHAKHGNKVENSKAERLIENEL
jgi:hypothetical protein